MVISIVCPVCQGPCAELDAVDFEKSCAVAQPSPPSESSVTYVLCEECGFCFAPEFASWSIEEFEARIYNNDYLRFDPDYVETRPRANAQSLVGTFPNPTGIRHMDYGGGSGLMSRILRDAGWDSTSYDPFVNRTLTVQTLGQFDLVTAYEVFEHVPDVARLMSDLSTLVRADGIVIFSTLLTDGNLAPGQRLTWWYAAPRNGHISLYSTRSLVLLGARGGFNLGSYSANLHAYWRRVPRWAAQILKGPT